jgi:hypothetical protein
MPWADYPGDEMSSVIVVPDEVRAPFTGELIDPADPAYEQARRVHNGLIDKRRADRPLPHCPRRRGCAQARP